MTIERLSSIFKIRNLWGIAIVMGMVAFASAFAYSVISPAQADAAVPTTMNFQGRLTNSSNVPVADGMYNMKFRIFSVSTGGAAVWTETRETTDRVQVTGGLFSVQLGSVTPLSASIFNSSTLYFEMELPTPATATCNTASCASFTEGAMTPRSQLATSAYAFNSETLDGLDSTQLARTDQANIFTGTQTIQADSTAALQVQNATGTTTYFGVDTSSGLVKTESLQAITAGSRTVNQVLTTVDDTSEVGYYSSIAIGSDGFARISYYDDTNKDLKFAQCTNADCTSKNITTVDAAGIVGYFSSIDIGSDGFARISYWDITNNDLKFAQCTNAACTTKNITAVDSTGNVGAGTSIDIGSDGFARISYKDDTNYDLKFAQCTNAACTTKNITAVDSAGDVGSESSIELGSDGFARISYLDASNNDLKFAQCTNAACTTSNITTVDSTGIVGEDGSLAIGSDGFARISYLDTTSNDLKFAQCTNAACTTSNITTVDSEGITGVSSSIALAPDGFARITYMNSLYGMKYAQCTNAACTTKNLATIDETATNGSSSSALAIGSDGFARVAYMNSLSGSLRFARLTTDTGSTSYAGASLGSVAASYGQLYATSGSFNGNIVVQGGAGSGEYAVKIQGYDAFLVGYSAIGDKLISIDSDSFEYDTISGKTDFVISDQMGAYVYNGVAQNVWGAALVVEKDDAGDGLRVAKWSGTGNIIQAEGLNDVVFTVGTSGNAMFRTTTDSATGFQVQNSSSAAILNVDTTASKVTTANLEVSAGNSLTLIGGTTRPTSPVEGMMFYDTTAKQLLVYANGKWQADRSTATKIVAASNSSQALKDGADYVADGTGDQTEINAALTAAAGGKVYLAEGTYSVNAGISVPSNTTLVGAGEGTVITLPNGSSSSFSLIENSNTGLPAGNAGISIMNLVIDGNRDNVTGAISAISMFADSSGTTAHARMTISGVFFRNLNRGIETDAHNSQYKGNYFDWVSSPISLELGGGNIVSDNTMSELDPGSGIGVSIYGSNNNVISGNVIDGGRVGVSVMDTYDNSITDNKISTMSGSGIYIRGHRTTITHNSIADAGGATANNAIESFLNADNNIITNNMISDASATTTNYSISLTSSAADNNYLADNTLGGGSINDQGTGTIYANQLDANGKLISSNTTIKSTAATAFEVQNTTATETFFTVNATANQLKVGNSTAAANGDVTVLVLDNAISTYTPTGVAGAMYYDSSNNKFKCYTTSWVDCDTGGAGSGANTSLSNLVSTNINAALNTTAGNLTLQTTTSGNIVLNAAGTTELMDDTNVGGNLTIATAKTFRITGDTRTNITTNYPSPSEGMMMYDTTNKQLMVYANGKWQADRSTATKIVAASNSSQALKDGADYVADGTGDQTEINAALTAAAGGKVYLAEGTYTTTASVSIPSNTSLVGSGSGTIITVPNGTSTTFALIQNSNHGLVTGNVGITVRNLKLHGNSTNITGTVAGISLAADWSGTLNLKDARIENVTFTNFLGAAIYSEAQLSSITDNTFQNISTGIDLEKTNDSIVSDNIFKTTLNSLSSSILVYQGKRNVVSNNVLTGMGRGINISGTSSSQNSVTGNMISDSGDVAIYTESGSNTISNNTIINSGGTTHNDAIFLEGSTAAENVIVGNKISDTSSTTDNYSINLYLAGASNYLAGNVLGSGSISDGGTGTIYANQLNSSGQLLNSSPGGLVVKHDGGIPNSVIQAQNSSGATIMKVTSAGAVQAASFDTTAAGTLTIGSANATSVQISKDTVVKTTSTTAFQVQNAGGTAVLVVDTSTSTVTIGSATNGVVVTANGISFVGTARPTNTITLAPEYSGATFIGDGTNNTGTLTSDFCSGASRMNVNATACGATDTRNYYQWSNTQATAQDYDLYVRYQIPSDYDTGSMTNLKILGWGTTTANETVTVALYSDGTGTACSTSGNAVTANATWSSATVASPLGTCTIVAGDTVTFKVRVAAGQNNSARAGAISFSYRQKF